MAKIKEVQKFYNKESGRYINDRYLRENCEQTSYLIRKQIVLDFLHGSCGKILDAGCGPAIFTSELAIMGLEPYSVDLSFNMLKTASTPMQTKNFSHWINCEIERLPFQDNAFDNVMSIGVIAYANDTSKAVGELARVLRPGGVLIMQCSNLVCPTSNILNIKDSILYPFNKGNIRWNFKLNRYCISRFIKILNNNGLEVIDKCSYDFRIPFLEKFFPVLAVRLMKLFQVKFASSRMASWMGEGYVVKAIKN